MKHAALQLSVLALAGALVACQPAADPKAEAAAQAAAQEQAAEEMAKSFETEYGKQNWALARAHGDVLAAKYPASAAFARIEARYGEVKDKAAQEREQRRTAALWTYQTQPVEKGEQVSASIYAKDHVDTDGSGPRPVQLIFRDRPDWGRSSYLVLEKGDFDCYGGCKVKLKVDDAAPKPVDASRPKTDEAIAMFIEDEKMLWKTVKGAKVIAIEFPVKAGGTRTAVFEVAGLDSSRMPKWN
ncbi:MULTISPECIES: hypothetical protein [unclassified Lysobacter]|uniref:hypothetical protein n=1 Tax=unclassified Lysobacter TaxID=2635362 RepID=UPI001C226D69|nr:hypothetical protein [Lysobacter sp. MMG2]MBU8975941.1 hypothetical protein [Lysobacter sp. MMG2]